MKSLTTPNLKIICERLLLANATFNFLGTTWRVNGSGATDRLERINHVCMYVKLCL